jgi:hypothetical protein
LGPMVRALLLLSVNDGGWLEAPSVSQENMGPRATSYAQAVKLTEVAHHR